MRTHAIKFIDGFMQGRAIEHREKADIPMSIGVSHTTLRSYSYEKYYKMGTSEDGRTVFYSCN